MEAELAALAAGDTSALVAYLENFELDLGHANLDPATSLSVYKLHLIAYLMCEQLDDARFLWKRLPVEQRDADAEAIALWAIGKAMWAKDVAGTQAAMGAYAWTPTLLSGLVERMQREFLQRTFEQCARAYSLISAEHLARTLGARPRHHRAPPDAPARSSAAMARASPSVLRRLICALARRGAGGQGARDGGCGGVDERRRDGRVRPGHRRGARRKVGAHVAAEDPHRLRGARREGGQVR